MDNFMDELAELKVTIATFTAKVDEWMGTTTEYRKSLCNKLDKLSDKHDLLVEKFSNLPCGERKGWYTSMGKRIQVTMWSIGLLVGILGLSAYRGLTEKKDILDDTNLIKISVNNMNDRVRLNTVRVDKLDMMHNIEPK
jgi:hypothetical protein